MNEPADTVEIDEHFERWMPFLHLSGWGLDVPAFKRLSKALYDVRAQRRAHNLSETSYEAPSLAVRVV